MNTDSWNDRATIQAMRREKHEQQIADYEEVLKWYAGIEANAEFSAKAYHRSTAAPALDVIDKYSQEG